MLKNNSVSVILHICIVQYSASALRGKIFVACVRELVMHHLQMMVMHHLHKHTTLKVLIRLVSSWTGRVRRTC